LRGRGGRRVEEEAEAKGSPPRKGLLLEFGLEEERLEEDPEDAALVVMEGGRGRGAPKMEWEEEAEEEGPPP